MKKYQLLMMVSALFWAGAFIAGKESVLYLSPLTVTFFRMAIAGVLLMGIALYREGWSRPNLKTLLKAGLLAIVGMLGYHLLFYEALRFTSAINASLLASTNPLLTYLMVTSLGRRSFDKKKLFFILVALSGVVLTITKWRASNFSSLNRGDLIMVFAVISWASYSVMINKFADRGKPLTFTSYIFLIAALLLAPFTSYDLFSIPMSGVVSVIYMAIFPTVIGYVVQLLSIQAIGAERTNIYINLVPVFSLLLAFFLLGERISGLVLLSSMITIGGVYGFNRSRLHG